VPEINPNNKKELKMSRFPRNGVDDDAFQINVITSDITYMKDTYCVAGWSPNTGQMKRLMINGNHWSDDDLKKIGKYASLNVNVIDLAPFFDPVLMRVHP
jgi:hypothetical protein